MEDSTVCVVRLGRKSRKKRKKGKIRYGKIDHKSDRNNILNLLYRALKVVFRCCCCFFPSPFTFRVVWWDMGVGRGCLGSINSMPYPATCTHFAKPQPSAHVLVMGGPAGEVLALRKRKPFRH